MISRNITQNYPNTLRLRLRKCGPWCRVLYTRRRIRFPWQPKETGAVIAILQVRHPRFRPEQ